MMPAVPFTMESMLERTIPVSESGCWLWLLRWDRDGYGKVAPSWPAERAHRAMWIMAYGSIPEGMCVCHHCDVPACVNPEHLFLGTNKDNQQDSSRKQRRSKPKSVEHTAKMRATLTGRTYSPDRIARMRAGRWGHRS
jgi:hypothetical protein